ncbi:MAG: glutamate formimidoyltransferase [Candidatus Rokubacteria bacterium]|nr:glutamate formimidoyltransferase [Candidatus Rokubacteria bacterium]
MSDGSRHVSAVIECVPNVSEGRDHAVLGVLGRAVRATPGVTLMDVHADADHHRAVLSFLGPARAVEAAALALADAVFATIDMRHHAGGHPRVGALDVLPFVPLAGTTMADAVALAHRVGRALAGTYGVPVYYYAHAARVEPRRRLPAVRAGEYEGLGAHLLTEAGAPDEGPARFDARRGAVLVGARDILVAYNVWLATADVAVARAIARELRESSGGLRGVQALGIALPARGATQVSMNLLDYRVTPIPVVFDRVAAAAAARDVEVLRAELVGLAPRAAFAGRPPESVGLAGVTDACLLDTYADIPS